MLDEASARHWLPHARKCTLVTSEILLLSSLIPAAPVTQSYRLLLRLSVWLWIAASLVSALTSEYHRTHFLGHFRYTILLCFYPVRHGHQACFSCYNLNCIIIRGIKTEISCQCDGWAVFCSRSTTWAGTRQATASAGRWGQAKEPSAAITFFSKFAQVFLQAGNAVFLQVAIKLE